MATRRILSLVKASKVPGAVHIDDDGSGGGGGDKRNSLRRVHVVQTQAQFLEQITLRCHVPRSVARIDVHIYDRRLAVTLDCDLRDRLQREVAIRADSTLSPDDARRVTSWADVTLKNGVQLSWNLSPAERSLECGSLGGLLAQAIVTRRVASASGSSSAATMPPCVVSLMDDRARQRHQSAWASFADAPPPPPSPDSGAASSVGALTGVHAHSPMTTFMQRLPSMPRSFCGKIGACLRWTIVLAFFATLLAFFVVTVYIDPDRDYDSVFDKPSTPTRR